MFIILYASYLKDCVRSTKCTFDDEADIHLLLNEINTNQMINIYDKPCSIMSIKMQYS